MRAEIDAPAIKSRRRGSRHDFAWIQKGKPVEPVVAREPIAPRINVPLAEWSDYETFLAALRLCREKRNISLERLDEITGLPAGYSGKLFGPRPIRRFGIKSLADMVGALGVRAVFVDDPEALALVEGRYTARDVAHLKSVQNGALCITVKRSFFREIGSKGGTATWKNLSKKQRSLKAKRHAKARRQKMQQRKQAHARRKMRLSAAANNQPSPASGSRNEIVT